MSLNQIWTVLTTWTDTTQGGDQRSRSVFREEIRLDHQRNLSPSGRVSGRRDRFTPCQNTRPAWQELPDAPHRLQYCQAAHQPAE